FRADMHAFSFALQLLPKRLAVQVFLYNIFLRFGVHLKGTWERGIESYGAVPYLLFHILRNLGFVSTKLDKNKHMIKFVGLDDDLLADVMSECSDHVTRELTAPETAMTNIMDRAINSATYFQKRLHDKHMLAEFRTVMSKC